MKLETGHVPTVYYLILWESYPEEKETWEPVSAV